MDDIHRPEIVDKTANALAYFVIMSIVTLGVGFIFVGVLSPVLLPWGFRRARSVSETFPPEQKTTALWTARAMVVIILAIYCAISWGILIWSQHWSWG